MEVDLMDHLIDRGSGLVMARPAHERGDARAALIDRTRSRGEFRGHQPANHEGAEGGRRAAIGRALTDRGFLCSSKAPIAEDIRYGLNHWDGLTRFLDDG